MKTVALFNPTVLSFNIGDQIILDSIKNQLMEIYKDTFYIDIPTHEIIFRSSYKILKNVDYKLVTGTNLLASNMIYRKPWKLTPLDYFMLNNITLMGVGWRNYEKKPNLYTSLLYKKILSKDLLHSVRDEYSKKQLNNIGIKNVLNTACPTMWKLTEEHMNTIPINKSDSVVFTLTDYRKDINNDTILVNILLKNYQKVYFFMQQIGDFHYINQLDIDKSKIVFINPTLKDYDNLLDYNDIDYVGTRLHGGIRALQKGKRTIIIGVDNRASEISNDTNLLVIERKNIKNSLQELIKNKIIQRINLPLKSIETWKKQFI